jgi:heme a synthase
VLAYTVAVILWGAFVRASRSGAGCGAHWPLCNGVVIPRDPSIETIIEFSHRLTSGVALIAVVVLLWWVWRACAPGHPARRGAAWSVFFMVTEAAVGAGLVLFEYVAENESIARAQWMAAHLVNTFFLLAWQTLTAWWLSGGPELSTVRRRGTVMALSVIAIGLLLVGASGAVAALGDTLFPERTLAEALAADLSPTSHLTIRLRILHPTLAVLTAVGLLFGAPRLARMGNATSRLLGRWVAALAALQLIAGAANVALLAPVWMQLLHLLVADLLWILFVMLGASVLARVEAPAVDRLSRT